SGIVGLWLPYLQIVLALCIGLRIAERVALGMSALLFATYVLAQISVLARGIEIDCGCFGFIASKVSPLSVSLPVILLGACLVALRFEKNHGRQPQMTP